MSEILPLFDCDDESSQKVRPCKRVRRTTPSDRKKSTSYPAIVLKPVTAELKELTLRQRVLPRYIFEQLISEPVLDAHTAEARGAVMGQVTVHNIHCERTKSDHLHLIWIHEGQLRYGLVWRDRPVDRYTELEQHIQVTTQVLAIIRSLDGWRPARCRTRTALARRRSVTWKSMGNNSAIVLTTLWWNCGQMHHASAAAYICRAPSSAPAVARSRRRSGTCVSKTD